MVDSSHSRRDHGKKRHHHHKSIAAFDDDLYPSAEMSSKRTSHHLLSSDKDDEGHRPHHHKSKKHKHNRDEDRESRDRESRGKHRRNNSPKDRPEIHHPVQIKQESLSPQPFNHNSNSRSPKSHKSAQSSGKRRHRSNSPDPEIPRKNERNHHLPESYSKGNRNHHEKKGGGNFRNQDFKKGKRKLGNYSPSDNGKFEWGKKSEDQAEKPPVDKEKPNFALSGKLTEDRNMYNGVVIKYSEPPEARKPKRRWRLYPFKGDEALPMMHIHRQSAFLLGRDRKVVDIPIDHPSCSKQHAALQYRLVQYEREDGGTGKRIRLYIIDLESANGTYVNNNKIEPKKYVELMERDVIKFGYSSREYVLLHEASKDEDDDE